MEKGKLSIILLSISLFLLVVSILLNVAIANSSEEISENSQDEAMLLEESQSETSGAGSVQLDILKTEENS